MNDNDPSPFTISRQNTEGIQGGPERTVLIEGPTTINQTSELASRLTPLLLGFLKPFEGTLANIGGIPSSDDQIILSLKDSKEFELVVKARFEFINSKVIRFSQHPAPVKLPDQLPQATEIVAGLSWYRPTRFALFNVGTPTLSEYFELHCHTRLLLKIGTSNSKTSMFSGGSPQIINSLLEILEISHGLKYL